MRKLNKLYTRYSIKLFGSAKVVHRCEEMTRDDYQLVSVAIRTVLGDAWWFSSILFTQQRKRFMKEEKENAACFDYCGPCYE